MAKLFVVALFFALVALAACQFTQSGFYNNFQASPYQNDFRYRRQGSYYNPLAIAPISDWGRK